MQAIPHRWLVAALLTIALAARLAGVWYARFDIDEAQSWVGALDVAEGRGMPALGPGVSASNARTPGPFFYAFMALPLLTTADPLAGSVFMAVLSVVGLWLAFRAIRQAWDGTAALTFLCVTALSPALVTYADRIWPSDLFPPFACLTLFALVRVLKNERSPWIAAVIFSVLVVPQVHIAFVCLAGVVVAALAVYRPRLNVRAILCSGLAVTAFYAPYVLHEARTGFENTRALAAGGGGGHRDLGTVGGSLLHFLAIGTTDPSYLVARGYFSGFDYVTFWIGDGPARTQAFYGAWPVAALLWAVQAAGWLALLYGLTRLRIARGQPFALFFWTALGSVSLFAVVSGRGGFTHYVLPWAPFAFIPVVAALRQLEAHGGIARAIAISYCIGALLAGAAILRNHYFVDSLQSIPQQKRIVSFVHEAVGDRVFRLDLRYPAARPQTYGVIAQRLYRIPWRPNEKAADIFTVIPRREWEAAAVCARDADVLVLDTLVVVHPRP